LSDNYPSEIYLGDLFDFKENGYYDYYCDDCSFYQHFTYGEAQIYEVEDNQYSDVLEWKFPNND